MQNKLQKLFEYNRLSKNDILEIKDIEKIITKIIDYYTMPTDEYENKYYMEIIAPILDNGLTIPGYVVELHSNVADMLEKKDKH